MKPFNRVGKREVIFKGFLLSVREVLFKRDNILYPNANKSMRISNTTRSDTCKDCRLDEKGRKSVKKKALERYLESFMVFVLDLG